MGNGAWFVAVSGDWVYSEGRIEKREREHCCDV